LKKYLQKFVDPLGFVETGHDHFLGPRQITRVLPAAYLSPYVIEVSAYQTVISKLIIFFRKLLFVQCGNRLVFF
jgi:hypothetical protein